MKSNNRYLDIASKVYEYVKMIPKGKVSTYGQIAQKINQKYSLKINPRYVGLILHKNANENEIPCHRVVNVKGKIAENFSFGGWEGQKRKLLQEGVRFRDKKHVNRSSFL